MDSLIQASEELLQAQEEMVELEEIQVDHPLQSLESDHGSGRKIFSVLRHLRDFRASIQMGITTTIKEIPTGM